MARLKGSLNKLPSLAGTKRKRCKRCNKYKYIATLRPINSRLLIKYICKDVGQCRDATQPKGGETQK